MAETKDWYGHGVNSLCNEIRNTTTVNTLYLSRVLHIYSWVDLLMKLLEDYKKCDNNVTKRLINEEMQAIAKELGHYKVFDDRFKEVFDDGR